MERRIRDSEVEGTEAPLLGVAGPKNVPEQIEDSSCRSWWDELNNIPRQSTRGRTSDSWIPLRPLILSSFGIVINLHLLRIRWDRRISCFKGNSAPVA